MNDNKKQTIFREDGTIEYDGKIIRHLEDGTTEYDGRIIYNSDKYDQKGKHRLKFTFVSATDIYEQCIILCLDDVDADIFWEGKKYIIPKRKFPTLDLFEKKFGKEFILDIDLREGEIHICNGTLVDGYVEYFDGECGMFIDKVGSNKTRYQCNSPIAKDFAFDDLTFEIEILD